ncbi:MAG: sigma factor-like helix-turn-helix DNA-binding protein, partial [Planctomycetota bacterium]
RRRARRELDVERLARARVASPGALAEEGEFRQELLLAIESLSEPYRPVLRLHLLHGLEPREIAHALERPDGTVRAQLARGLEALRRALPAGLTAGAAVAVSGRGLAQLRACVIEQAGGAGTGTLLAAPLLGGLTLMASKTLLTVTALAGAALLGILYLWREPRASTSAEAPVDLPSAALAPPELERDEPPPSAARTSVVTAPVALPEVSLPPAEPPVRALVLRVLREADRSPLVGVGVCLQDVSRPMDLAVLGEVRTTDAEGRVRFTDPPRATLGVHVDRAGVVRQLTGPESGVQTIDVFVPPGIHVQGRVLGPDGDPVAGASILAHGVLLDPCPIARSDADGRFALEEVRSGIALAAQAQGRGHSLVHPVLGLAGAEVELELVLAGTSRRVEGRVLASDGSAAAGAVVAALAGDAGIPVADRPHARALFVHADAEGRYELEVPSGKELLLVASPLVCGRDAVGRAILQAGTHDATVEVNLPAAAVLEGHVSVPGSARGAAVSAWPARPDDDIGYLLNMLGLRAAEVADDGTYRISGMMAGEHQLQLYAGGTSAQGTITLAPGEVGRWDVDLSGGEELRVRVELPPTLSQGAERLISGVLRRYDPSGSEFVTYLPVPPDGLLVYGGLSPDEYEVVVTCSYLASGMTLTLATSAPLAPGGEELLLAIPAHAVPGGSVRGRLVGADGRARAGQLLRVTGGDPLHLGYGRATTDGDGNFSFAPLQPGNWFVWLGEDASQVLGEVANLSALEERDLGTLVAP